MNINENLLKEEEEYLKLTRNIIQKQIDKSDENIKSSADLIVEMKKYVWENVGDLDDIEVMHNLSDINNNVSVTNVSIDMLQKLKKSLKSPYFGRVDFECDDEVEKIYIGITGIIEDLCFYVYDWRAPISSLFYNYETGTAEYEAPCGQVNGEIKLKRQYKINNDIIERCFDSNINIDDEYLQEILANSSSEKMTNIVNTIQREQNQIIRNIIDKYLIVQGVAGSGKTSVALHRIAYLLYKEKNLNSNNILIFSPNDVFSDYISDVLPELGENNVLQTTFSDFASSYIKEYKKIESYSEFIDRYYKQKNIEQKIYEEIKFKLSDDFKSAIDNYLNQMKKTICFTSDIKFNELIISKEELTHLFNEKYIRIPVFSRLEYLSEYICDCFNLSYKKNGKLIKEKLKANLNIDLNVNSIYNGLLNSLNIYDFDKNSLKVLKYEDLIPIMYIFFEMNGYPISSTIKHVVIDEAQDYSLLQFELLKNIFPRSSFTILGDVNQTINPFYKYNDLSNINHIFNNKGNYIELNKTYRSSEEIIEYTNKILDLKHACSIRRSNSLPVVLKDVEKNNIIDELKYDIEHMKSIGIKRIAIITKNLLETKKIYEKLKNSIDEISLIDGMAHGELGDLVILPSYISKGLEFDGVIAFVEKNNLYQEKDKNLFYVVCTRAQHSLTVYNQKKIEKKWKN
ncbi:MAG: AAA family ATPase [Bacilli bacterium]|nr:AAA family ATPase [Bacilli bacterium]